VLLALLLRISHDTGQRQAERLAAQSVTEVVA